MAKSVLNMTLQEAKAEAARRNERRRLGLPLDAPHFDDTGYVSVAPFHVPSATVTTTSGDGAIFCACRITLMGPPRTKKNHVVALGVQSAAYRKWRDDVKDQLEGFQTLPDRDYNLSAHFYVDRYGRNKADLIGLIQGLADVLEAAGVVTNDKQFMGLDNSRRHDDEKENYRTEVTITPLTETR